MTGNYFKNKKVAVLGWGINGLDIAKYLLKKDADITIFDCQESKDLDFSNINTRKIKFALGNDYLKNGLINYDYIFRTPGVYRFIPEIVEAEKRGVIITSAVRLFFDLCPARIIGVTGTKGKGTTCTLIYEILKKDGKDVFLAGNIGLPFLDLLPFLNSNSWVILELSSFQLIDMTTSPHIAVILNITEDHMDWHKDRVEYIDAKSQLVRHQNINDISVLAYDYKDSRNLCKLTKAKVFYFSNSQKVDGVYVDKGNIKLNINKKIWNLGNVNRLLLRGKHNQENVCAAFTASYFAGANINSIKQSIFSFKGLEHRLELVREINGIKYYNDSFSTNPQTTVAAVRSFSEPITLILGGSNKNLRYDDMGKEIVGMKNVKNIILIGNISEIIEKSLIKTKYQGNIFKLGMKNMKDIVRKSFDVTKNGGVVLLSPATASFDMFKDYKDRGLKFKKEVLLLKKTS